MRFLFSAILLLAFSLLADSPFQGTLRITQDNGVQQAEATVDGPAGGHINDVTLTVDSDATVTQVKWPQADEYDSYPVGTHFRWAIAPPAALDRISFSFQGCTDTMCYLPQQVAATQEPSPPERQTTPAAAEEAFWISEPLVGYAKSEDFLSWLERSRNKSTVTQPNLLERIFARSGWLLTCLLTVILGIALNLTPCVLPMIPITLGVLGAKSAGNGRFHGAMLGGIYGCAMALTYGLAGCAVVLLGGRIGAVNSNPYFQFSLAVVFVLLGLAMFDLFLLDFSRFRDRAMPSHAGAFAAAAFLGMTAALMAGACIAPVLIWVLLLSARLYADGAAAALWLPLLLGIGLGLPWPFLGAGIGALPRPGAWMNHLKKAMGVLILLFACYTAWNGFRLMRPVSAEHCDLWRSDYATAMAEASYAGKPVLLDFWGVSCKACQLMEATTFRDAKVRDALKDVVCISVQGDQGDGAHLAMQYGIAGFPTYILLVP
ncbi:MAG: thioredoxin family protein [Lentisphaeria bacterium]|nr:thioredoxin family protein [Lentisphaeria bacterium]